MSQSLSTPTSPVTSSRGYLAPLGTEVAFVTILMVGVLGLLSLLVVGASALVPFVILMMLGVSFNLLVNVLTRHHIVLALIDKIVHIGNLVLVTGGIHFSWGPRSPFLPLYAVFVIVAALRQGMTGARQSFGLILIALAVLGILDWPLDKEAMLRLLIAGGVTGVVALAAGRIGQRQLDAQREAERRNREMAALLTELERLGQQRTEFIQNVVHDLRNPLTYLQGYSELLLQDEFGPLTPAQLAALKIIDAKTQHMDNLISDIALMQIAETGKLRPTCLDLIKVVQDLLIAAQATAERHRIVLRLESTEGSLSLQADKEALEQIINNLISNAIKYSPDGGTIAVCLYRVDGHAYITVMDEGIGLTPEDQNQLFTRFYRAPTVRQLKIPGTGLGLAIVKQLTAAHGGQVWVESEPGRGSTFHVTLPLADSGAQSSSSNSKSRSSSSSRVA